MDCVYCIVQQVDDGVLAYRPALEGIGSNIYSIGSKLEGFAYQAKVCLYILIVVYEFVTYITLASWKS